MRKEFVAVVRATITAGTPAGAEVSGKIVVDPVVGEVSEVVIPKGRKWTIVDVYVTSISNVSVVMNFIKNGEEVLATTPPIDTLLVSNPSRPIVTGIEYKSGDRLTVTFTTLSSVTTNASVTVYCKVVQGEEAESKDVLGLIGKALGK